LNALVSEKDELSNSNMWS